MIFWNICGNRGNLGDSKGASKVKSIEEISDQDERKNILQKSDIDKLNSKLLKRSEKAGFLGRLIKDKTEESIMQMVMSKDHM